ncbi:MAG: hypothetical protein ACP5OV_03520 [Acidimicrobiales bacterium]
MTAPDEVAPPRPEGGRSTALRPAWVLAGTLGAIGLYVVAIRLLGGIGEGDAAVSLYSTWAIAHGHLACAYPPPAFRYLHLPGIAQPYTSITPFYPVVSGLLVALFRIGHATAFPSAAALGPHCAHAYHAIFAWSVRSSSALTTMQVGYVSAALLPGAVVLTWRASQRPLRGRHLGTLALVALAAPVLGCLLEFYHPQDLLALALSLAGVAAALRRRWGWAGVALGLAVTTHQFALLLAVPFLVLVPRAAWWRYVAGLAAAVAVVDLPFLVATAGRAARAIVIGSGFTRSYGGTVVWELTQRGASLFALSRVAPILAGVALVALARWRLGDAVYESTTLLSLVGVLLGLRLVFEVNLWSYYFAALATLILVVEAQRERWRPAVAFWWLTLWMAFDPLPAGFQTNSTILDIHLRIWGPTYLTLAATVVVLLGTARHRLRCWWWLWVVGAGLAFVHLPVIDALSHRAWPIWLWQILLVPWGMVLVATPLITALRRHFAKGGDDEIVTKLTSLPFTSDVQP